MKAAVSIPYLPSWNHPRRNGDRGRVGKNGNRPFQNATLCALRRLSVEPKPDCQPLSRLRCYTYRVACLIQEKHNCRRYVSGVNVEPASRFGSIRIGVDNYRLAFKDSVDRIRNKLLRVLPFAKGVHRVGNKKRKFIGIGIGKTKFLSGGLGGGLRISAIIAIPFSISRE